MTVKIFNKEVMAPNAWLSELGNELNELINFRLRFLRHRAPLDICIFYFLEILGTLVEAKREEIAFKKAELKMKNT